MNLIGLLVPILLNAAPSGPEKLQVADGLRVEKIADVPGARSLAVTKDGTIYVGTGAFSNPMSRIYRVRDWNKNHRIDSDEVEILIEGLKNPNGVAVRENDLYVAETNRILVFKNVQQVARGQKVKPGEGTPLPLQFSKEPQHGWRYIRFAPPPQNDWLYISIGAPCNVCLPEGRETAVLLRINVVEMKKEVVARGVRNSVGFDFSPTSKHLWFTDNGRDWLGDDQPDDELNEVVNSGDHFGFPYCHANNLKDPETPFDNVVKNCASTRAPKALLGAHVAALGMTFYRGTLLPKKYRGQIFIAQHGSWNRTRKVGYRLVTVDPISQKIQPVVWGWLNEQSQTSSGRPVDVAEWNDGSLILSEDTPGALYRIAEKK